MSMNGIDIASYQSDMDCSVVDADFVIIKITQGDYYNNPSFPKQYKQCKDSGKLVGMYHYSNGVVPASSEVDHLLKFASPYLGKALVCLDWETNGATKQKGLNTKFSSGIEVSYTMEWIEHFYSKTGIFPVIYMSSSVTRRSYWGPVASRCPLWVAKYANDELTGYKSSPAADPKGYGAWNNPIIIQYTPSGSIKGYEQTAKHKLDLDMAYITKNEWLDFQNGSPVLKQYQEVTPKLVKDILDGVYGNGLERREKLSNAGYNLLEVQAIVNKVIKAKKDMDICKKDLGKYYECICP